jgi:hypothetical protein
MDQSGFKEYIPILESIMRISLAGFGGAMAGLSISRRAALMARPASSVLTKNNNNPVAKKKHVINRHHPLATRTGDGTAYAVDRELPAAWAMACMAFTGVIEFTRFVSPSGFAIDLASKLSFDEEKQTNDTAGIGEDDENIIDATEQSATFSAPINLSLLSGPVSQSTIKTIADYTIGGALGGAIFAGSAVRTNAGRKLDAAMLGTATRAGGPLAGLLPGAGLGLLAGVTIFTVDYIRELLEEQFGEEVEQFDELSQENTNSIEAARGNSETIPAHIKAMSNEELAKAIVDIKR